jgi:hypothetical protein
MPDGSPRFSGAPVFGGQPLVSPSGAPRFKGAPMFAGAPIKPLTPAMDQGSSDATPAETQFNDPASGVPMGQLPPSPAAAPPPAGIAPPLAGGPSDAAPPAQPQAQVEAPPAPEPAFPNPMGAEPDLRANPGQGPIERIVGAGLSAGAQGFGDEPIVSPGVPFSQEAIDAVPAPLKGVAALGRGVLTGIVKPTVDVINLGGRVATGAWAGMTGAARQALVESGLVSETTADQLNRDANLFFTDMAGGGGHVHGEVREGAAHGEAAAPQPVLEAAPRIEPPPLRTGDVPPPSPSGGDGVSPAAPIIPPPEPPQAKAQRTERDLAAWMEGKRPPAEPIHQPEPQSPVTVTLPDGSKARGIFQGREGDTATVAFFDEPANPEGIRGKTVTANARAVKFAPLELTEGEQQHVQASEAATSPLNDKPEPTPAQQEAGNYPKGHLNVQGLDISIENPQGSTRSGVGPDGQPWSVTLGDHYGYIRKTEGADGDHVDAYVGPNPKAPKVFLVDQIDPATGKFDEHKTMIGFNSEAEALAAYARGFSDGSGPERLGAMTAMPMPKFKRWLKTGDATKPFKYEEPSPRIEESAGQGAALQYPTYEAFLEAGRAAKLSDADIAQATGVHNAADFEHLRDSEISQYVEGPAQDAVRRVYAKGGSPFSSNAYGPGRKGVEYLDSAGKKAFEPIKQESAPAQVISPVPESVPPGRGNAAPVPKFAGEPIKRIGELGADRLASDLGDRAAGSAATPFSRMTGETIPLDQKLHPATGKIADLLASTDLRPKVADIAKAGKMTVEDAKRTLSYLAGKGDIIKQTGVNAYRKLPRRTTPLDLIEFLASKGGIKDDGGELAARDLGKKFAPGFGKLVRKSGRSLDEARELAQEAGYLPRDNPDRPSESDIGALLDAIDQTHRGTRVYRTADLNDVAEMGEKETLSRERGEMEHHAQGLGIDVKPEMTRDDLIEAIRVAEREEALKKPDHLVTAEDHAALDEEREALVSEGMRDDSISDEERAYLEREFAEPQEASGTPKEHPGEAFVGDEAEQRPGLEEGNRDRRETGPGREAPHAEGVQHGQLAPDQAARQARFDTQRKAPETERTDQGTQLTLGDATGHISDAERAQRGANASLKPKVPQKRASEGLFDVQGRGQQDIADRAKKTPMAQIATEPAKPFFSALTKAIKDVKQPKAPVEQWRGIIDGLKNKGVKEEELAWSGVRDWLAGQKGSVTKEAVLDHLRQNEVKVEEVTKTGKAIFQPTGQELGTKFEQYTLPGGENYRELLLTLPPKPSGFDPAKVEIKRHVSSVTQGGTSIWYDGKKIIQYSDDPALMPNGRYEQKPESYWMDVARQLYEKGDRINKVSSRSENFQSPHFDEPNVLAHIRMNDRTDAEGRKVLHVEEIQSDWHQKGRKQGYQQDEAKLQAEYKAAVERQLSVRTDDPRYPALAEATRDADLRRMQARDGVPDAPFKSTWHELALKRVMRYAAEHGYDRVTWTKGEQQAERYDLSKHIDSLKVLEGNFEEVPGGAGYHVTARKDGREVIDKRVSAGGLSDLIGKEMADKAIKQIEENKRRPVPKYAAEFSGLDLKVGGEGMKGFYDKILPAAANKIGKQFGAKVGETTINATTQPPEGAGFTREKPVSVHSIDITPSMRSQATEQGFPLFKTGEPTKSLTAKRAELRAAIHAEVQRLVPGATTAILDRHTFKYGDQTVELGGSYMDGIINVSLASRDPVRTATHEALHMMRDIGIIKPSEWDVLARVSREHWMPEYEIEKYYGPHYRAAVGDAQAMERMVEEGVAHAFADFNPTDLRAKAKANLPPLVFNVFKRIANFFARVRAVLEGAGFHTLDDAFKARDTFEAMQSGEVGKRPWQHDPYAEASAIAAEERARGEPLAQAMRDEVAATLKGDELGQAKDIVDLRRLARSYAEKNLAGRTVKNEETGFDIKITRRGLGKLSSGAKGEDLVRAIPAIPEMLQKGKLLGSEPDRLGRGDIKAVHRLTSAVEIGGKRIDTVLIVRETKDGRFFYDLAKDRDARTSGTEQDTLQVRDTSLGTSRAPEGDIGAVPPTRKPPLGEVKRGEEPAEFPAGNDHAKPGRALLESAGTFLRGIRDDLQMKVAPMAVGSDRARVIAKTFANNLRVSQFRWGRADAYLEKTFTPEQRARMWRAGDEQSVIEQTGEEHPPSAGLGALAPDERAAVDTLHAVGEPLWDRAKRVGIVKGEGLPSYMPRMLAVMGEDGTIGLMPRGRSGPSGGPPSRGKGLDTIGRNLTTAGPKGRKYLFSAETESAAGKVASGAKIIEDIRTLPLAYSRLERAIAGKELINSIKEIGEWTGQETVRAGAGEGFFTLDHPAFQEYRIRMRAREELGALGGKYEPVMDDAGNPVFDRSPIYVAREFEGPLRAILTKEPGAIYNFFMALKAKTMSVIMYSPLIHNEVEWGRAFGLMPSEMLKVGMAKMPLPGGYSMPVPVPKIYRDGFRLKQDPAQMIEAIEGGLVPIGHRGFNQDVTGIAEAPNLKPGRSLTSQILGGPVGLVNEKAGNVIKRGIDRAGDIWHNTLLWDRVADLQMGLYQRILAKGEAKGLSRQEAVIVAAHEANRFAGALPNESMSKMARQIANFTLFSRSFTLGNLGAMKDAAGLPRDVQAMLKSAGADAKAVGVAGQLAASFGRRAATGAIIKDIALAHLGLALVQSAVNLYQSGGDWEKEKQGYVDRWHRLVKAGTDSLWNVANPFADLHALSPTAENEPGKENRVDIGYSGDHEIYGRLPTGKIGEEFEGYITNPLDMIRHKVGTVMRPLIEIYNNDMGFGRKVYDPKDPMIKEVADVVWHLLGAQGPLDAVKGVKDLYEGAGDPWTNKAKVIGPLLGVTVSQGAPGGKAEGEIFAARREHEARVAAEAPAIRRSLDIAVRQMRAKGMDTSRIVREVGEATDSRLDPAMATDEQKTVAEGARKLRELGVSPGLIKWTMRTVIDPSTRLTRNQQRDFDRYATPEQRDRLAKALGLQANANPAP